MTGHEPKNDDLPVLLTVEETARCLKVHCKTVYNLIRSGELPSSYVGRQHRIKKVDLEEYLQRQETNKAGTTDEETPGEESH